MLYFQFPLWDSLTEEDIEIAKTILLSIPFMGFFAIIICDLEMGVKLSIPFMGFQMYFIVKLEIKYTSFNSLYGILILYLLAGAGFLFQFPLWDSDYYIISLVRTKATFNSLYGIRHTQYQFIPEIYSRLSIPFMGFLNRFSGKWKKCNTFNSLYGILLSKFTLSKNKNLLSIPFMGFCIILVIIASIMLKTFNSLYGILFFIMPKVVYIGKLSIPFMGFAKIKQ